MPWGSPGKPNREVVFFAIGFETTAPSTALTLMRAKAEGVPNFSIFCDHVTIVPPDDERRLSERVGGPGGGAAPGIATVAFTG